MKRIPLAAVLLLTGCLDFAALEKSYSERDVLEKVGIVSHLDIAWPNSAAALRRAIDFYNREGIDELIVLGDPTRNGYPAQHQVVRDTINIKWNRGAPPKITMAADSYEWQGITWTNEGRYPLTDLMCVQPLDGKRINVGSMHGIEVSPLFLKHEQRTVARQQSSAQGLLVMRRKEGLTVKRMDFSGKTAAEVGPAWEVDASGLIHLKEGEKAPEFWPDTRISVVKGYDKVGNVLYTVRWPPVLAKHTGERAFSYEVSVGGKVLRYVQSHGFFLPESEDGSSVACIIAEAELHGAEPRFGVTPVSSMGLAGKTVYSP